MFEEISRALARLRRRLRRLVPRGQPARRAAPVGRAIERLTRSGQHSSRPTARCGCAPPSFGDDKDRVLIRSNGEADLLRRRHRLLPRQARARLRPVHLPARRRPPRLRRPAEGDGGLRRRRPRQQPRGPDRPDGQDPAGRRGAAAVQAGRRPSSRSTSWSRRSASTRCATRWRATRPTPRSTSTSTVDHQAVQRQPGLLRAVRPRPHLPDDGERRRPRDVAAGGPAGFDPRCSPTSGRASCCARWPSSRGWWPAPPSCGSRTGSPATSRTPPRSSTSGTTPRSAGCCRRATSRSGRSTWPAWCSSRRPARCSPTASDLLGVSAPERM